jgi:hypothetical protein
MKKHVKLLFQHWSKVTFTTLFSSWFSALSQKHKSKLQVIQNKIVRFITNSGPRMHIGNLNNLQLLNVTDRVTFLKLSHVYKIFYGNCPDYLQSNFTKCSDLHHHNTRGSMYNFIVPKCQGPANKTFYSTGIREWNALPPTLKGITNSRIFKRETKKYLANKSYGT